MNEHDSAPDDGVSPLPDFTGVDWLRRVAGRIGLSGAMSLWSQATNGAPLDRLLSAGDMAYEMLREMMAGEPVVDPDFVAPLWLQVIEANIKVAGAQEGTPSSPRISLEALAAMHPQVPTTLH